MSRIVWDQTGSRLYETGVKNGVLYVQNNNGTYPNGVAWNGLSSVSEKPSGAESTAIYADDMKYLNLISAEEFGATVEAYTYPKEFEECDGSAELVTNGGVTIGQQNHKTFGMCYKTTLGNDVTGNEYGYKLHIIYGAKASPSEKSYSTINDSPEAITFSWELTTTPVNVTGFKATASLVIDSTKVAAAKLTQLENILYGSAGVNPRLPLPDEIASIIGTVNAYPVTNQLINVTNSNTDAVATSTYSGILSANDGCTFKNAIVTMGGVDVTTTAYTAATHAISIASVTGPIVIYATANTN